MSSNLRIAAAVGLAVALAAFAIFSGGGGTGGKGPEVGEPLPAFAAPLALSDLVGDANIDPDACSVSDRRALVGCREYAGQPLAVGFVAADDPKCAALLPALGSVGGGVRPVAIGIRGERKPLAELARANPGVSVAWDRDGALTNRFGVVVCPTVVVVQRGGRVAGTLIGEGIEEPGVLARRVRELLGKGAPGTQEPAG